MEGQRLESIAKLPIGIEDFAKLRTEQFYYVDKTGLLIELLNNWGEVNLITRPRRFGKSLNMSMLRHFFSYGCDATLYDGLAISREKELCEKYMGRFPVIFLTLKSIESRNYAGALVMLHSVIKNEARRFRFLLESEKLSVEEKQDYLYLIQSLPNQEQTVSVLEDQIKGSLLFLSQILCKHYGQKVIFLMDEYDIPLEKPQQYGYYDEMTDLIRGLLGQVLKTNENLYFAVLTGCLRIARESIFTGLNNFNIMSITHTQLDEHFGFTDTEVYAMLDYYGLSEKHGVMKEWYDGYRFGNADVYCPWDVINYVNQLRSDPAAMPKAYWINSSGNVILHTLLQKATSSTKQELEALVNGSSVVKRIREELTYRELYNNLDNIWSVLFTAGYLTKRSEVELSTYELAIPNREIRGIFTEQIFTWFQEEIQKDTSALDAFCEAVRQGDPASVEQRFRAYLKKMIHIHDNAVRKNKKENFYHGILLGLLSHREDWVILSNAESGEGYSDILIEILDQDIGIVMEIKYSESRDLEAACVYALDQIEEKNYEERLLDDSMTTILRYGIACRRNTCMVRMRSNR